MQERQQNTSTSPNKVVDNQKFVNKPPSLFNLTKTNLTCYHIFIPFTILQIAICIFAYINGNPTQLGQAYDVDHNACGHDVGFINYPYIYFATPFKNQLYKTVCVKECPEENNQILDCVPNSVVKSCEQSLNPLNVDESIIVYTSFAYKQSICIPRTSLYYKNILSALDFTSSPNLILADIYSFKYILFLIILLCVIAIFLLIQFINKFSKISLFLSILFVILFCAAASIQSFTNYQQLISSSSKTLKNDDQLSPQQLQQDMNQQFLNPSYFLMLCIIMCINVGIGLYFLRYKHQRLKESFDIYDLNKLYIRKNPQFVTVFVLINIIISILIMGMFYSTMFTISCGYQLKGYHLLPFAQFKTFNFSYYALIYSIFYFSYLICVFQEALVFIIANSILISYRQDFLPEEQLSYVPVYEAVFRFQKYYYGSILLSSLMQLITLPFKCLVGLLSMLYEMTQKNSIVIIQRAGIIFYPFWFCQYHIYIRYNYLSYLILSADHQKQETEFFQSSRESLKFQVNYKYIFNFFNISSASISYLNALLLSILSAIFLKAIYLIDEQILLQLTSNIPSYIICMTVGYTIGITTLKSYGSICEYYLCLNILNIEEISKNQKPDQKLHEDVNGILNQFDIHKQCRDQIKKASVK